MPTTKRRPTAKQRAAQKAWAERQRKREAWQAGREGSGAVPLDGETSWSLEQRPRAFDEVGAKLWTCFACHGPITGGIRLVPSQRPGYSHDIYHPECKEDRPST